MRAVRLTAFNAPLIGHDVDEPAVQRNEVKVRIEVAGICHSDAHYRAGFGTIALPRTPGHEIAGTIIEIGDDVRDVAIGDRVALHYLKSCGVCRACREAGEQFCETGEMIGKQCDGGYAESIVVPAANAIRIPDGVQFNVAAVMMCSTATAYHALRVAGLREGQHVAILGLGGLGISALHLSRALGAGSISVVDVVPEKLKAAAALGARINDLTDIDVAIDFTGRPEIATRALQALNPRGTLVIVALSEAPIAFNPYRDLLGKERRIAGCSDHLRSELVELMQFAADGTLKLDAVISRQVPLDADAINGVLDDLERGTAAVRSVIVPRGL
jgi:propanol-preferring alcohol dehydrogenase